ncbi:hypothetical protein J6590_008476 [Homalodisca vitripennis]|nr:hypothetical protein J6590_008476 [Homalodisca vitripennis]
MKKGEGRIASQTRVRNVTSREILVIVTEGMSGPPALQWPAGNSTSPTSVCVASLLLSDRCHVHSNQGDFTGISSSARQGAADALFISSPAPLVAGMDALVIVFYWTRDLTVPSNVFVPVSLSRLAP